MPLRSFHPTVRSWFLETVGEPTGAQERGWPLIRAGGHTLIAAPTGSGKTFAAFLSALDGLLSEGAELPDETRVLYVSPLRALSNDIQKNLQAPLEELRERDPGLPEVRVLVRTGDTPQKEREGMKRRPPHILVTTPESLYILLTSEGGRALLRTVRTAIVDEIHAILGDKRGAHLALSLERLDALVDAPEGVQRIGLSATQKPLSAVGRFLAGRGRECTLVDEGHLRELDLAVEVPPSPLETVCSHETWTEIYRRIAELIEEHRTTLVFVGTRKLAERISAQLAPLLGEDAVACHHSSLAKERRLEAEQKLKAGELRALVATASLELGIDIGDVDLVCQVGTTSSIAAFLQRVGRAGHGVGRTPKGRLFPVTRDELPEASALIRSVRAGDLDVTQQPAAPLDILAQQIVADCVNETWEVDALYERMTRAWPYRELERETFEDVVDLHTRGRRALLHRDGVRGRLRGTKRARLTSILSGGAIPDRAEYKVVIEPEGTVLGSLDEDFAIESSAGDIVQLGAASWQILKVESGLMRVADAKGAPPTLPFWLGEAPARTHELSEALSLVREGAQDAKWIERESMLPPGAAAQLGELVSEGKRVLGTVPTTKRIVLERFFDESGGMQLVVHSLNGSRINRAFGFALRKRFCRHFGFELQAAANEDAIVLSLGPQHSFPLEEVFDYLHPRTAKDILIQAILPTPMFGTRWRWNVCRALLVERMWSGKRVPAPLLRMRSDDLLAEAFPDVVACGETLPQGDIEVPLDHPLVAQTIHDCLHEAMDVDGFLALLNGLRDGSIERVAVDTPEPSAFACSILNAMPYSFLDDAPLEERRTQAVMTRRVLDPKTADELGALSPEAVARVRDEAWPQPTDAEEVHEALLWMGYVTREEAAPWQAWLDELVEQERVVLEDDHWFAVEAPRDPKTVLRGRLEALGPIFSDDPLLAELERDGVALRCRLEDRWAWCDRRLLARIQRYTLEGLRREIEPVSAKVFLSFLAAWQHVEEGTQLEGPAGLRAVLDQLAGFEIPAGMWERKILARRVKGYRPEWLDELGLRGEIAWGRLWGDGHAPLRSAPLAFVPRRELNAWLAWTKPPSTSGEGEHALGGNAASIRTLLEEHGAMFAQDLESASTRLPSHFADGLSELIARGHVTADSFAVVRHLLSPLRKRSSHRTRKPTGELPGGRWSLFRNRLAESVDDSRDAAAEFAARVLLRRYGVIFRKLLERERVPVPWRDLARVLRTLELRGDVRGGRFVARFAGEQFALPEAIPLLRKIKKRETPLPVSVASSDPLNLEGILTPGDRVPSTSSKDVALA